MLPLLRLAAASLLAAPLVACGGGRVDEPAPAPAEPRDARYVGRDACRTCHAKIFASYALTGMGRSWYPLTRETAVEDFDTANAFEVPATGLRYRMEARDGRFVVRQFRVDSRGREVAVDERPMIWVAGSGNHSRSYATEVDGRLFQMPVCWYPLTSSWDLCPGYEHKNEFFSREISATCVFCHNARMELEPGTRNRFREPIPHGIDCERCHGPGSLHVATHEAGVEAPEGAADPTIVNPRRLPARERIQVCFQCHLGDSAATERVVRHGRSLTDFRPGRPLSDVVVAFRYEQALPHSFGIASQADRLVLSRCWTASGGGIECLTCHDPHVTVRAKDRDPERFRKACLGCHEPSRCEGDPATRGAVRPADDCVQCHMRRGEPHDHPHTLFTDHWIRRRVEDPEPRARSSIRLEPVDAVAFETLPAPDRAFYEGRAWLLKGLDLPGPLRLAAQAEAETAFRRARASGFSRPEGLFFLGKALQFQGRADEAADAFKDAHLADPSSHDAAFAWGQSLLRRRQLGEAAGVFEHVLRANPSSAGALAELARCRLLQDRPDEALDLYRRAIAIEPWQAPLHANLAMILAGTARAADAVASAREAVRAAPDDAALWRTYAEVARAAGLPGEADEADRVAARLAGISRAPGARGMMGM